MKWSFTIQQRDSFPETAAAHQVLRVEMVICIYKITVMHCYLFFRRYQDYNILRNQTGHLGVHFKKKKKKKKKMMNTFLQICIQCTQSKAVKANVYFKSNVLTFFSFRTEKVTPQRYTPLLYECTNQDHVRFVFDRKSLKKS